MENKSIKVLLIEDSAFATRLAQKMLADAKGSLFEAELKSADRLSAGLKHISKGGIDIVLLDLTLPDSHGMATFKRVHKHAPGLPIVVMSGSEDEELAIEAVKIGAQDYLVKGQVDSNLLKRSILYAIRRKHIEEELKKHKEHLEELVDERTVELRGVNKQLRGEITKRKKVQDKIKASLREKEVLLQEVHHRVKNNMQIISSLLRLQSRKIKGKRALEAFESSCNRVKSMVLIHERLYQSKDFARIDFAEYVHGLTNHLFSLFQINPGAVKLDINIKDISLDLNTAIPCGLIVNELVSNSLKHAFPEGRTGRIKVIMKSLNKNEVELTASDNGIGIPDEVDFRETKSLGLHLVSILAEDQLRGKIKLDRTKGTRFEIKFKAKQ